MPISAYSRQIGFGGREEPLLREPCLARGSPPLCGL
jgi:hypothetical protein